MPLIILENFYSVNMSEESIDKVHEQWMPLEKFIS